MYFVFQKYILFFKITVLSLRYKYEKYENCITEDISDVL